MHTESRSRVAVMVLVWLAIVVAFVAFFAVPFTPYAHDGTAPPRATFFLSLLVPENFVAVWFGETGEFSIADRAAILTIALLGLATMRGYGRIVLTLLRVKLARLESELFAIVLGMNVVSTLVLFAGMAGIANNRILILVMTLVGVVASCIRWKPETEKSVLRFRSDRFRSATPCQTGHSAPLRFRLSLTAFSCLAIFAALAILAGAIPSTEYDVVSYHLAAARDFAETGRIGFVVHTPYANMPFGAEMWGVWAMTLCGDAFIGGLVFKTLVAATTVITGLGLYAFGRRLGSESVGLVAMLLYVSTPWILYTSTVGLVDSVVGMNAWFAFYAVWLARRDSLSADCADGRRLFGFIAIPLRAFVPLCEKKESPTNIALVVAGLCAGGAAACKYTAVPMVVTPLALAVFLPLDSKSVRRVTLFALAVFVACGAWYIKNWWWTGNPFYPLAWSIFGDSTGTWDAAVNARWSRVHSPNGFTFAAAARDFALVTMASPWLQPLLVPLAVASMFVPRNNTVQRRTVFGIAIGIVFVLAIWWTFTHRIDRFLVPLIPFAAILAAVGAATICTHRVSRATFAVLLGVSLVYGLIVGGSPAPGKNATLFAPLESQRSSPLLTTPWATWFHKHAPRGAVLLIGEAKAFLYDSPVIYSSCFNETPLREMLEPSRTQWQPETERSGVTGLAAQNKPVTPSEYRLRSRLPLQYVLVDWSEIARFRSAGNYGFSDFVTPELFDRLVAEGQLIPFDPPDLADREWCRGVRVYECR